ncbi:MAG TPA: glycoside hydrolase domain-containing protein [Planctomycetota bacterium]|jgi:hypothetical protein
MNPIAFHQRAPFLPVLLLLVASFIATATAAELHVWTVSDTRHVLRGDAPEPLKPAQLCAARNEWESVQILVRSDAPIAGIKLEAGDLCGPLGALKGSSARLYRQHAVRIENGTHRNATFKADWYPDPLIPFQHPVAGKTLTGARIAAVPFDLPASETHGFWVDLFVPEDARPGEYSGTYRVTTADGKPIDVPVSLTVWNFTLPATPSLFSEFGSPAHALRRYLQKRAKAVAPASLPAGTEQADWPAVEEQCSQLLADHHLNAVPSSKLLTPAAQPDGSFKISSEQIKSLRDFIDRYHVNAIQTPHPSSAVKDPVAQGDKLRAWLAAFDAAAKELDRPNIVLFTYLKDEPNTADDYAYVQKWGRAVREAKSVVKVLVVEQTYTKPGMGGADSAWGDLYGAIDIWVPLFSLHDQESAAKRQALGEQIWTYTALCQGKPTPWWHIDYPLLNYRVPASIAWRCHMKGLLYWGGLSYWGDADDPWTDVPKYYGNGKPQQGQKGIVFNGEGSLVYPARAIGYDGIAPTIRLKALRDGIEDFEYLALLERAGKSDEADKILRPLAESWFSWEKDPAAWQAARTKLAALLIGK